MDVPVRLRVPSSSSSSDGVTALIRAVAIYMTTAYELDIKAISPNAEVVYELFRVVAAYEREVID